ncbi:SpoIIE family protein phosphatase [Streptomyces sp. DSM 42041]|uniref:SpoIIE family protein phosphatase n=1 Tax=Streptomyces hazeniae TaxID=3075538 RepID=A0ABU2NKF0_9ACTN|nr:SpoIIE family protein phosphatase [Streptomyces sp. DSM 42041]MDT0377459.1 SpoIIE family protein phosphatase [Streptomyces sp. DSM 42041]
MARNDEDPFHPANVAALIVDGEATVLGCTPGAEDLLRRPARELRGRPLPSLLTEPDDWPAAPVRDDGTFREGTATLRIGDARHVEVSFSVLTLTESAGPDSRCLVLAVPQPLMTRWRQNHAFIEELFLQRRVGLAVFDPGLRIVRTNTPLLDYPGVPDDLTGMRLADFLRQEDAERVDDLLRGVVRTGEPLIGEEVSARTRTDPRAARTFTVAAFRLQLSDGQIAGVTTLFNDTTEEQRARARLDLLHRATALVGSSLSVTGTARDLADVLTPGLADVAAVDIAEAVFGHRSPAPDDQGTHLLRRAATTGDLPVRPRSGGLVEIDVDGPHTHGLWQRDPAARPRFDDEAAVEGARSGMSALLCARGLLLGRVTVWRTGDVPFDEKDVEMLDEIASRVGLVLDNARRFGLERRAAVSLQSSLLPPAESETVGVRSASVYLPTEVSTGVSGDWFDVIPLSSARVALVVGDVVGHGLHAIATMGRLRTAVRTLADLDLEPDELLTHLDDLVSQLTVESGESPSSIGTGAGHHRTGTEAPVPPVPYDSFGATCLYVTYDPVSRLVTAASAGHPPLAVLSPDGRAAYLEVSPGPPLGVGGLPFEPVETTVDEGSVLALFTDGLVERGDGDVDTGMAALLHGLRTADPFLRPLPEVGRDVVAGLAPTQVPDDITLLLARTRAVPPADTAAWTLEADPEVVADARRMVARRLVDWDLDDLVFTTELVTSELVTNAVRHAGGPIELRLIRAGTLICEVSDPSNTQPRMRRAGSTEEGGRGLYLVAQLAGRWGSRYARQGKTIWAEQPLPPAAR